MERYFIDTGTEYQEIDKDTFDRISEANDSFFTKAMETHDMRFLENIRFLFVTDNAGYSYRGI